MRWRPSLRWPLTCHWPPRRQRCPRPTSTRPYCCATATPTPRRVALKAIYLEAFCLHAGGVSPSMVCAATPADPALRVPKHVTAGQQKRWRCVLRQGDRTPTRMRPVTPPPWRAPLTPPDLQSGWQVVYAYAGKNCFVLLWRFLRKPQCPPPPASPPECASLFASHPVIQDMVGRAAVQVYVNVPDGVTMGQHQLKVTASVAPGRSHTDMASEPMEYCARRARSCISRHTCTLATPPHIPC